MDHLWKSLQTSTAGEFNLISEITLDYCLCFDDCFGSGINPSMESGVFSSLSHLYFYPQTKPGRKSRLDFGVLLT